MADITPEMSTPSVAANIPVTSEPVTTVSSEPFTAVPTNGSTVTSVTATASVTTAPVPTPSPASKQAKWTFWHSVSALAALVATGCVSWFVPSRLTVWIIIVVLLTLFIVITANGTTGDWRGALIDDRNTISLSRLQMSVWTILILSALLTAGITNIRLDPLVLTGHLGTTSSGGFTALGINIPSNIWLLLGIATTSLVATPLILNTKTAKPADDGQTQTTMNQLAQQRRDGDSVTNKGQLIYNTTSANARWSDLFTGEEVGNAAQFDLGKIQLFYFTFILALVYAIALGALFASQEAAIKAFPDMDAGMLALLGISHAGYLVNKAVPHSADPGQ